MRGILAVLLVMAIGLQPAAVCAQAGDPKQTLPTVEELGLSLDRIKRELRETRPSDDKNPLKLDFYVEVFALAPPIPLFQPGELTTGPVPGGAPTHADILNVLTPKEFRSGAVPVSTLAIMGIAYLLRKEADREKRRKAEEERQKRNEELRAKYPYLVKDPDK